MKRNQFIAMLLFVVIFWIIWEVTKIPIQKFGGISATLVPVFLGVGGALFVCQKSRIVRFIPELSAALAVDEIFGTLRVIGPGIQFLVPWEKISGNEFTLEARSQDFGGDFETTDGSSYNVVVTITIIPDVRNKHALETYNSLGAKPTEQAFRLYGPAAGGVVQTFVAGISDKQIRHQSEQIKADLVRQLDMGQSEIERQTGTQVVSIGVGVINPDKATRENLDLERRLKLQSEQASKMVAASGGTLSFKDALEKVQIADKSSKSSAVSVRGGARSFFNFNDLI